MIKFVQIALYNNYLYGYLTTRTIFKMVAPLTVHIFNYQNEKFSTNASQAHLKILYHSIADGIFLPDEV